MEALENLEKRLEKLQKEIEETKKRLPAHSTKPPVMIDLPGIKDEYDQVFKKIQEIKTKNNNSA